MISSIVAFTLATGFARAALVPTAPGPGQVFKEGGDCTLSWNLDTSGKWTSFNVDLMSGSNLAMQTVTNVFKARDGTKGDTTYTWKCPQVTPHSAIYFYQFTQSGADTTWTTRFAIASSTGEVTPPSNSTQPGGAAIPWGVGHLAGAASSSTNETIATPPAGSNTAALTTPPTTNNTTNTTSTVPATSNLTTMNSTTDSALTTPPKQSTSSSSTPSSNQGSSTTSTRSSVNANTTPASTSAASLLMVSKVVMTTVAFITLSIAS